MSNIDKLRVDTLEFRLSLLKSAQRDTRDPKTSLSADRQVQGDKSRWNVTKKPQLCHAELCFSISHIKHCDCAQCDTGTILTSLLMLLTAYLIL